MLDGELEVRIQRGSNEVGILGSREVQLQAHLLIYVARRYGGECGGGDRTITHLDLAEYALCRWVGLVYLQVVETNAVREGDTYRRTRGDEVTGRECETVRHIHVITEVTIQTHQSVDWRSHRWRWD